jgi:hypothetical protein
MMKNTAVITQRITTNARTTANMSQLPDTAPPGDLFNVLLTFIIV